MKWTLDGMVNHWGWGPLDRAFRLGVRSAVRGGQAKPRCEDDIQDIVQEAALRLRRWLRKLEGAADEKGHLGMCRQCGYRAAQDWARGIGDRFQDVSIEGEDFEPVSSVGPVDCSEVAELIELIPDTGSLRAFAWALATSDGGKQDAAVAIGKTRKYQGYLCNRIRNAFEAAGVTPSGE